MPARTAIALPHFALTAGKFLLNSERFIMLLTISV